ncbi:MAG TPA: hypothetical protein PLQ20_01870 [Candidatus Paceibacterota bacterium]|nr:hypothetical protein [Candidatus Paceibacterota bacterium]
MENELKFIVACEYANVDKAGKVTAGSIFSRVLIPKDSNSLILNMYIVASFTWNKKIESIKTELVDPNNQIISSDVLKKEDTPLAVPSEEENQIVVKMQPELLIPGKYSVNILINNISSFSKQDIFRVIKRI